MFVFIIKDCDPYQALGEGSEPLHYRTVTYQATDAQSLGRVITCLVRRTWQESLSLLDEGSLTL